MFLDKFFWIFFCQSQQIRIVKSKVLVVVFFFDDGDQSGFSNLPSARD